MRDCSVDWVWRRVVWRRDVVCGSLVKGFCGEWRRLVIVSLLEVVVGGGEDDVVLSGGE